MGGRKNCWIMLEVRQRYSRGGVYSESNVGATLLSEANNRVTHQVTWGYSDLLTWKWLPFSGCENGCAPSLCRGQCLGAVKGGEGESKKKVRNCQRGLQEEWREWGKSKRMGGEGAEGRKGRHMQGAPRQSCAALEWWTTVSMPHNSHLHGKSENMVSTSSESFLIWWKKLSSLGSTGIVWYLFTVWFLRLDT